MSTDAALSCAYGSGVQDLYVGAVFLCYERLGLACTAVRRFSKETLTNFKSIMSSSFRKPKLVLVFNRSQILIGVLRSVHTTAEFSHGNLQSISFCCNGRFISAGGYYFRYVNENILIEISDLDTLKLPDYDRMCGEKRQYHSKKAMAKILKFIATRRENHIIEKHLKSRSHEKED